VSAGVLSALVMSAWARREAPGKNFAEETRVISIKREKDLLFLNFQVLQAHLKMMDHDP